ncbi:MAG: outer membrane protein assembly factor BamE domain-containing protein [Rickettsiales bacterium]
MIFKKSLIIAFLFIFSCADNITKHGIELKEKNLEKLTIGETKQLVVEALLGVPTIKTQKNEQDVWLYFDYQRNKRVLQKAYYNKYLAYELTFKDKKLVKLAKYNLQDMKMVDIEPHITRSVTKKESILKQFLKNIGRFEGNNDL